jgi:biopolymer transport protein ExbB
MNHKTSLALTMSIYINPYWSFIQSMLYYFLRDKRLTGMKFTVLELFSMGGPIMWPLLIFSIAVAAISLERLIFLLMHKLKVSDLKQKVDEALTNGEIDAVRDFLQSQSRRYMCARILLAIVKRYGLPEQSMEKAAEAEAQSCISELESGFNILTALGSISPLTGFLGTVTGMISAFRSIAEAVDVNAQIVASGIYEALITTVFGLCIAIVAMTAHSIFSHIVDRFAGEVESACSALIISICESKLR